MKFRKKNVYGHTIYQSNNIVASYIDSKLQLKVDDEPMYSAGFVNITSVENFLDNINTWQTELRDLGFEQDGDTCWGYHDSKLNIAVCYDTLKESFEIYTDLGKSQPDWCKRNIKSIDEIVRYIFKIFDVAGIDPIFSACICDPNADMVAVTAAISSRDLSKKLQRVKSSNLWSYAFDIKDRKDKFGTLLIQFKGTKGGPGDIYQYFDVPVNLWRRFISATSKGHFFWVYIRNNFKYRKLTGDKRGKLPNAIN
jgi:hypothetical protein